MVLLGAFSVKYTTTNCPLSPFRGLVLARSKMSSGARLKPIKKQATGDRVMPDADKKPEKPIGDPPTRKQPVRADQGSGNKQPNPPMMDPFTEQSTHSAGDGQGASAPGPNRAGGMKRPDDGGDEETMPIEEGFSPVP
jgi:hypothetical protein